MDLSSQLLILSRTFPYLEAADLDLIMQHATYRRAKNKETLIRCGDREKITFFILSGMVRGYFLHPSGEEKNLFLRPERTFTGAPDSLFTEEATRYTFEAIQETHLLILKFEEIERLAASSTNIAKLYIEALKENLKTMVWRVESLVLQTPEERYDSLLARSPDFFQKAFLKHIANYLGMTPVSLSRIMKRKKEQL